MIKIIEIPIEEAKFFWEAHIKYLIEDENIGDEEIEYFSGDEYRNIIKSEMLKEDKLSMVWFVKDDKKIGASQYKIYKSKDGECFILDFWIFPEYRKVGLGQRCLDLLLAVTKSNGALFYRLNSERAASIHFWERNGFMDIGVDEFGSKLFERK